MATLLVVVVVVVVDVVVAVAAASSAAAAGCSFVSLWLALLLLSLSRLRSGGGREERLSIKAVRDLIVIFIPTSPHCSPPHRPTATLLPRCVVVVATAAAADVVVAV